MLYNICRVALVLLLCGVICGGFCNTLSEKKTIDVERKLTELDAEFHEVKEEIKLIKAEVQSIHDALSNLLSALQDKKAKDLDEEHGVQKRAVVSVGSGLSGLPDALLDEIGKSGGEVYTRWGRTKCGGDSTLLYSGYAGSSNFNQPGGGVNYQCMSMDPQYSRSSSGGWEGSWMSGVEYHTYYSPGVLNGSPNDQNVPCARCYTNNRPAVMMIPAKTDCLDGWTKEYQGYLMTERDIHNHQTTYECVDESPEFVTGLGASTDGGLFFFVRTHCNNGGQCPPYDGKKEMTCVVCSK